METAEKAQAGTTEGQFILSEADHKKFLQLKAKEDKQKAYARKVAVKTQIILEKAKGQGITATKAEIDARIAKEDAKA